ncbi:unnamed protein product [Aphanomyces euteiches]
MPSMKRSLKAAKPDEDRKDIVVIMSSKDAITKALLSAPTVQLKSSLTIQFISKASQLANCHACFQKAVVVGLDTETKPEFKKGAPQNPTSLLQIATRDKKGKEDVFILDLLALKPGDYNDMLSELFLAPSIVKMGQSLFSDLKELVQSYPSATCFNAVKSAMEANDLFRAIEGPNLPMMSLQKLVYYSMKQKLVKTHQKSNWNRRPLSPGQLSYAALDALVLVWIYDDMRARLRKHRPKLDVSTLARDLDVGVAESFTCTKCQIVFSVDHAYYSHTSTCTGGSDRPFQCTMCSRRFVKKKGLAQHVTMCKKNPVAVVEQEDEKSCYCGRSRVSWKADLTLHHMCAAYKIFAKRGPNDVYEWTCVDCAKAFESPEQLLYHHGLCKQTPDKTTISNRHMRFESPSSSGKKRKTTDESVKRNVDGVKRLRYQRTASEDFTDSAAEDELWNQVGKCGTDIQGD